MPLWPVFLFTAIVLFFIVLATIALIFYEVARRAPNLLPQTEPTSNPATYTRYFRWVGATWNWLVDHGAPIGPYTRRILGRLIPRRVAAPAMPELPRNRDPVAVVPLRPPPTHVKI